VPREPRPVSIREFILEAYDPVTPVFRVRCSKGTYVRSLVEDLARQLGTLAHVIALRRLWVEPFGAQTMASLPQIEALAALPGEAALVALDALLRPLQDALPPWPVVRLDGPGALRLSRGGAVRAPPGHLPGLVRLYGPGESFLGVGEVGTDGVATPRRLVAQDPQEIPGEWAAGL
jgi:tRNA pseudouridine55 synthase